MTTTGSPTTLVDDEGLHLSADKDDLVDLLFDGRRVWSFRVGRVGSRSVGAGRWLVGWPPELVPFLHGSVRLTVVLGSETTLFDREVRLGAHDGHIELADSAGRPLVLDSGGRLAIAFEGRPQDDLESLLDALARVLHLLDGAGVPAFPVYGTLLGAVRDRDFIGHDNDADVGYLSRFGHPVDVIRESFRLQRVLAREGFASVRHSAAAFKVLVREGDDLVRGLDVFAGSLRDGHLMLMGELLVPFERQWMLPLGTVVLAGRDLPAPAEPERLLTAMYGPSWRVPDPTFEFSTPDSTKVRLNGWFRGTRFNRSQWDRRYSDAHDSLPDLEPHRLAKVLHRREPRDSTVIDVGCGRGQDARWLATKGHRALGLDYSGRGFLRIGEEAHAAGLPVSYHEMNLLELRQTLLWGARLSRLDGPKAMLARHLVDATSPRGRQHLWRLASMVLGAGGRLYVAFAVGDPDSPTLAGRLLEPLDPDLVEQEVEALGGRVTSAERFVAYHTGQPPSTGERGRPTPACQMVMEWT